MTNDEGDDANFVTKPHPLYQKNRNFTKNSIMNFRTSVEIPKYPLEINHSSPCIFTGSCFAENIGQKILETKIPSLINPLGIHYNPMSLAKSLNSAIKKLELRDNDLFFANGVWNSFDFHSSFSGTNKDRVLLNINNAIENYHKFLKSTKYIFITFGTSYIYELKENGKLVTNCHKQSETNFKRRILNTSEIINTWKTLFEEIKTINPEISIIFTVSPVRHLRDGASNNQLSKATLLLAINELQNVTKNAFYFPSYEIVMDELRDYRFYNEDMIHPSDVAVNYIMEKIEGAFFSKPTIDLNKSIQKIIAASKHRPFNTDTENYKTHCKKMLIEVDEIIAAFPGLDFNSEIEIFSA